MEAREGKRSSLGFMVHLARLKSPGTRQSERWYVTVSSCDFLGRGIGAAACKDYNCWFTAEGGGSQTVYLS